MALDWTHLVTLAGGWLLSQVGSYLDGKRSTANALAIARETRQYELGKDAYKAAMRALGVGFDVVAERRPLSADEALRLYPEFIEPIRDARMVFGLPISDEMVGELTGLLFAVGLAREKGGDVSAVQEKERDILRKQRIEIEEAWQRTIHGNK